MENFDLEQELQTISDEAEVVLNIEELRKLLKFVARGYKVSPVIYDTLWNIAKTEIEEAGKVVMIKRDPNVERDRIAGSFVKIYKGESIRMSPPAVRGFGADFDGDTSLSFINIGVSTTYDYKNNEIYHQPNAQLIENLQECVSEFDKHSILWYNVHISEVLTFVKHSLIETKTKGNVIVKKFKIKEPIYVKAVDVKTGKIDIKQIEEFSIHENIKMYKISRKPKITSVSNFKPFWMSEDHSMVVYNLSARTMERQSPTTILKNPDNFFLIRDKVLNDKEISIKNMLGGIFKEAVDVSEEEMGYLLGAWLGDGYITYERNNKNSKKYYNIFALSNSDDNISDKWCSVLKKITKNKVTEKEDRKSMYQNAYDFKKKNGDMAAVAKRSKVSDVKFTPLIMNAFGKGAEGKKLPEWICNINKEFLYSFIAGYIDTDGSINNDYVTLQSKSETLINNLCHLLKNKFNIDSSVFHEVKKYILTENQEKVDVTEQEDKWRHYYTLNIKINLLSKDFFTNVSNNMLHADKKTKISNSLASLKSTFRYPNISFVPYELVKDMSIKDRKSKLGLTQDHITKIKSSNYCQADINIPDEMIQDSDLTEVCKTLLQKQNNKEIEFIPCSLLNIEFDENETVGYDLTVKDFYTFATDDGIYVYDSMVGCIKTFKNIDNELQECIINIADFHQNYKCELKKAEVKPNGVEVLHYYVKDEVYAEAFDIKTGNINKKLITEYSIHKNLDIYNISSDNKELNDIFADINISGDKTMVAFDHKDNKYIRTSIEEIEKEKERYSLVQLVD